MTRDYLIRMPPDTWVKAACEDAGCDQWAHGWETICDLDDDTGRKVAFLIRSGQTGRDFTEFPGNPVVFRFAPRQRCFREHRTRPARFSVRPGPGRALIARTRLADWGDDMAEHLGLLADGQKKG